ncbi:WYL domain-containing protein [Bacillus kexueae]|uniref:WYL domain-containing protein n=1 Tax=Aeribacillus kexueae TaxID=2078952 RepID=UPI001FAF706B|nr:WYL domain-containing protein [Bacillus kexueae]
MCLLQKSCTENRPLTVIYEAKDGTFSKRTILVQSIKDHHIYAYCYQKRSIRTFRKESILAMAFLNH